MNIVKYISTLAVVIAACGYPGISHAILSDKKDGKWSLIGQLKAQATFRTEASPPNTPIPIEAGDMISQRNLFMLEWKHNLGSPWFGTEIEYDLKVRAYYDGAWDYGPKIMTDDEDRHEYCLDNRDQINKEKWAVELFQGYVDFTKGPFFSRIGRQVMSWGEMSTIRILDGINPLDTSSLAVDMSERLIPLWMVRANLAFNTVGPFESVSLGGYYVSGKIDNTYDETIIDGSPMVPTIGRDHIEDLADPFSMASLKQYITVKESDIDRDRFGVKLGMIYKSLDFNLAYYRMYSEYPAPQIDVDAIQPVTIDMENIGVNLGALLGSQKLTMVKTRDIVDVFGCSFNYDINEINTVMRAEAAYFKDVPKMPPGYVSELINALTPKVTPPEGLTMDDIINLMPLSDFENRVLLFTAGAIPKYDVIKYGIGLDKWVKIPKLSTEDFLFTFEYVGSKTLGYKEHSIIQLWYAPWDDDRDGQYDPVWEPEYSNTFILIMRGNYLNGNLIPQLVTMYEVEPQAFVLIPSVKYNWRYVNFELSWFMTTSNGYEGTLGMLDKRDELSFSITWSF
jgi:hypothetical protein